MSTTFFNQVFDQSLHRCAVLRCLKMTTENIIPAGWGVVNTVFQKNDKNRQADSLT
ncbi:hypothetical protein FD09_GL001061 [Schleiferilactobacillus perolens DSM 12744]|jgi:hypothetical protein|uniref:Uncharacterized protein n=2 Tax=Schleiferilactobacillus perolens TaxID=100468 RepID=A0A0R1MQD3_9LACO|nr:hypothetical protein FD09_GL001061 [Schleiferilactobacillus perolens DSM 12744]